MRVVVDFQGDGLEFELSEERCVASWNGPKGLDPAEEVAAIRAALEAPQDYPPLRKMLVPGDQIVVALDPTIPRPAMVLDALGQVFEQAGIEPEALTVLSPGGAAGIPDVAVSVGSRRLHVHDASDRAQLAYLASTEQGRRVYLDRLLTDADVVVPVGRIGFDGDLEYRGPWSVVFPGLSDQDTIRAFRRGRPDPAGDAVRGTDHPGVDESVEVSWLLGTQFHVGLLPGANGLLEAIVGRDTTVRDRGIASLERHWSFRAPSRAEVVVAGVGRRDATATLEDLANGLATATRLVQHGGKIILLSRASGPIGPALRRLMDLDDPRTAVAALRGHEAAEDYRIARRLAGAMAWADLFVYSDLDTQVVEDLSMVALDRPEQARRLVANGGSASFLSRAELTRAGVDSEP
jgi:nickel-dependent lactate racemase